MSVQRLSNESTVSRYGYGYSRRGRRRRLLTSDGPSWIRQMQEDLSSPRQIAVLVAMLLLLAVLVVGVLTAISG